MKANALGIIVCLLCTIQCYSQRKAIVVEPIKTLTGHIRFVRKDSRKPVNAILWDSVKPFQHGIATSYRDGRAMLVGGDGIPVSNVAYDAVRKFSNGRAPVSFNGKWGYISQTGSQVIPLHFELVNDFSEGVATAKKLGRWHLIDLSGKTITSFIADSVSSFNDGVADVKIGDEKGLVTNRGKLILLQKPVQSKGGEIDGKSSLGITAGALACPPNIDFEYGNFSNWNCYSGNVEDIGTTNVITVSLSSPSPNRHTLIQRNSPSALDRFGLFPTNPPDGSGYAIKLGNNQIGGEAERVRYVINVPNPASDFSIKFQYAAVLENPDASTGQTPHEDWEQPRLTAKMQDAFSGEILPCASFVYIASEVPGFLTSTVQSTSPNPAPVRYKPWSAVYVNLSKYAGRTLYFDLTTADCTQKGHFGYAYVDVVECEAAAKAITSCAAPYTTALSGPPGFQTYTWYDEYFTSVIGNAQNVTLTKKSQAGKVFNVVVKPYNNNDCPTCDCRDTIPVRVQENSPLADAGPDKEICLGLPVQIGSAAVSGNSYLWSPSNGLSNPYSSQPIATITTPTTYSVTVTNQAGCSKTDSVRISMLPIPEAAFTNNQPFSCLTSNHFTFKNASKSASGNLAYLWRFGDGQTATQQDPQHSYNQPGTYKVTLQVTNSHGCADTASQDILIYPQPVPSFSASAQRQCIVNNNFLFSNQSTVSSGSLYYSWFFGDGDTSSLRSPSHSYKNSGIYVVKMLVINSNGCLDSTTQTVYVEPKPVAGFTSSAQVACLKENSFYFINQSIVSGVNATYAWDFGDGERATTKNSTHIFKDPGSYRVLLKVDDGLGCSDTTSRALLIHPNPIADFYANATEQCEVGNKFLLNNSSQGYNLTYSWNFGDGTTSLSENPSHSFKISGSYSILLQVRDENSCVDTAKKVIKVHSNPAVRIVGSPDLLLCRGENHQLAVTGATTYTWKPAVSLSCQDCYDPIASPVTSLMYHVSGANAFGCTADDSIRLNVVQPFQIQVLGDTICAGESIKMLASGAKEYLWSPASSLDDNISATPLASPKVTTTYQVVGYDGFNCFTDTAFAKITVGPFPTIQLGPDIISSTGSLVTLSSNVTNGPIIKWQWAPSDFLTCSNCPAPTAETVKDISYVLRVTNDYGCSASDSISIKATCDNGQVFIPNAFTPDGDGINDVFMVQGKGIGLVKSLRIFNRWGELLFEKRNVAPNNPSFGWDGTIRGLVGPPDVFVYMAEVVCSNGTAYLYKGNVSLLK